MKRIYFWTFIPLNEIESYAVRTIHKWCHANLTKKVCFTHTFMPSITKVGIPYSPLPKFCDIIYECSLLKIWGTKALIKTLYKIYCLQLVKNLILQNFRQNRDNLQKVIIIIKYLLILWNNLNIIEILTPGTRNLETSQFWTFISQGLEWPYYSKSGPFCPVF